ncbi:MAG: hypothetical protein GOP50_07135 [Candidatus Heimdallarchaeota archaeon]|nr:hypothetical protein [Candidatus Heimdallarchaeota archaeon]
MRTNSYQLDIKQQPKAVQQLNLNPNINNLGQMIIMMIDLIEVIEDFGMHYLVSCSSGCVVVQIVEIVDDSLRQNKEIKEGKSSLYYYTFGVFRISS